MKKFLPFLISILLVINFYAQDKEYSLQDIIISTGRTAVSFPDLARSVVILNSSDIKLLPVSNIQDVLKYIGAVDLKTRGAKGIQGDAGIRGGTFEQTLIMLDGIKISDPQTGHHNLNIPINFDNIERIEILKGHGSRIFGPNAFGGAINIITKKEKKQSLSISTTGGENNYYDLGLSFSQPIFGTGNNISLSKKKSDGYRHNTNFDVKDFSIGQNYFLDKSIINIYFGFIYKKFGANNFYSDKYPNQWEHTTTTILNVTSEFGKDDLVFSPKLFWRRGEDDYILDNSRPSFYRNIHKTYSYGGEIQASLKNNYGIVSFGGELINEEISSSSLGNHSRLKGGFFAEQFWNVSNSLSVTAGFYVYNYSNIGWKIWPGIDAAYNFSNNTKVFASIGQAFRIPTFTELYYKSPANIGNPNLKHENTTNYEIGFSFFNKTIDLQTSVFFKNGKDIIDWARITHDEPWKVENVSNLKTFGYEIGYGHLLSTSVLPVYKINFNYTYLSANRTTGIFQSKYVLENLRHQLIINFNNKLPLGIKNDWSFIFTDRENYSSQFTIDTQIGIIFYSFDFFLRITNLTNRSYEDFPGIVLPGRWITAGIKFSMNDK